MKGPGFDPAELALAARELARDTAVNARAWCREDRAWVPRALVLVYMTYAFARLLADPGATTVLFWLDFGIHELGHKLFIPTGELGSILGGSILQCTVPVIGFVMFWRQRDYFAMSFALGWLSANLSYVAWYCADARSMEIPLLSVGGGEVYHDWNYILDRWHLLAHDHGIANGFRALAAIFMLASLGIGGWLVWLIARAPTAAPPGGRGTTGVHFDG